MAGLGRKTFAQEEILRAADVNGYLMDQSVMRFANSTARSSAIATATEGMVSYLDDANAVQVYDGSNWVAVGQDLTTGTQGFTALSNGTAGLTYQPVSHNYIINGAFDVWQRGTSVNTTSFSYTADRWFLYQFGSVTASRQLTGLTGLQYGARVQRPSGQTGTNTVFFANTLPTDESIPLAGKQITASFWAKRGADFSPASGNLTVAVNRGTGTDERGVGPGFTGNAGVLSANIAIGTSWQRYTITGTVTTTATQLQIVFSYTPTGTAGANDWFEVTGVQLEAGSVATPFKRHAPSLALEEAACQRYYIRYPTGNTTTYGSGYGFSATSLRMNLPIPVTMRSTPSLVFATNYQFIGNAISHLNPTLGNVESKPGVINYIATVTGAATAHVYTLVTNNDVELIAEL
jgi:hypothetical protein